ncbi:hypothetical protein J7E96_20745 [Streptomyces sp. ISL-96]|uniref:hypothetical protein n=1 Tax=unclassified Streptomyces TaxID=2593676 RepID=UPI001BEBBFFD|nr:MULTISPECIES: hypothetical protein [unclassified Streptomyces]MBT2397839.1 hypothetical protein [Streptomyces sp. ISL-100]MBT2490899.1 hypothetical protein [Streptomyces sp. ISL-96]
MAVGGFDVDHRTLKIQGEEFREIGREFVTATGELKKTLEGIGTPWGEDVIGGPFDVVYQPVKDGMLDSMESLGGRLKKMGTNLRHMGDAYGGVEKRTYEAYKAI